MKRIVYSRQAAAALAKHGNRARLIIAKIERYASNPAAQANLVKALVGSDYLRLRVGDFRVIFSETAETITVIDIGPRGNIYH